MWGSNLFHVGILVIFFGHFAGLLTPIWVFDTLGISHTFKQWLAISVGGISGKDHVYLLLIASFGAHKKDEAGGLFLSAAQSIRLAAHE